MMHSSVWKIDQQQLEVISDIDIITKKFSVPYLLIGAVARDLIVDALGIGRPRLTYDIDLAVLINGWEEYERLAEIVLESGRFRQDNVPKHRFIHLAANVPVDIIPFGPIEEADHIIKWPAPDHTSMSTLGFEDAYNNSISVTISDKPKIIIRVASRPGFAIMKLIAWNDNRSKQIADALDLLHLIRNYLDSDNLIRLYDEHSDIATTKDFDYECAGAMLLGRDIAFIASPQTLKAIDDILVNETSDDSNFKLISDMLGNALDREFQSEQLLQLLSCLRNGIQTNKNDVS